ncbi:MAG: ankyrin repeat domain-containing protein [Betaproteobacteria bacterium]|nr:ankyrin repeat domain-containing protein [Betaproteobacteria bacterium]
MKAVWARQLGAMIIGMALAWPAAAQFWSRDPAALPTPTAFVNALELGDIAQARAWLDAGLPPDFMGSRTGSGLMIGAWEGNIDLMRLFISRGADINRLNGNGESALILAAWRGHLPAVKWLIERGARINPPPRQWSPLHYAVFAGHREIAEYLLGEGADINALSTNGSSVLMMAVYEGREDMARLLLERGAGTGARNDYGDGALEWAMRYNHLNIARLVTDSDQYAAAVSQPKEIWGEPQRSLRMSKELEELIDMREKLVERGQPTEAIDRRIASERARLMRTASERPVGPARAVTLEITASRKAPQDQSARIVDDGRKPAAAKKTPDKPAKGKEKKK